MTSPQCTSVLSLTVGRTTDLLRKGFGKAGFAKTVGIARFLLIPQKIEEKELNSLTL